MISYIKEKTAPRHHLAGTPWQLPPRQNTIGTKSSSNRRRAAPNPRCKGLPFAIIPTQPSPCRERRGTFKQFSSGSILFLLSGPFCHHLPVDITDDHVKQPLAPWAGT